MDDMGDIGPRNDDAGIGAWLSGGVHPVFPDEGRSAGHGVDVEEEQGAGRMHAQAFEGRVGAVLADVVDAHEPCVFRVLDVEGSVASVLKRATQGHVVGDGPEEASAGQDEVVFLAGEDVASEEEAAVFFAVDVFEHFAFAAAAGAFMGDGQAVVVGSNDLDGGAVHGDPAFAFAAVEEHAVDAFLCAGAGIEVVAEHFIEVFAAAVDDHLPAIEMGVAENRSDEYDAADIRGRGDVFG